MGFLNRGGFGQGGSGFGGQNGSRWQPGQGFQGWQQRMGEHPSPWFQQMQQNRPELATRLMTWQPGQGTPGGAGTPLPFPPSGLPSPGPMETGTQPTVAPPDVLRMLLSKPSGLPAQMTPGVGNGQIPDFLTFLRTQGQTR